jgi:hypothetical protein
MSAILSPGSASSFRTVVSSASVVGQTSGQYVNPKNTSVGWPRKSAGVTVAPWVSIRAKACSGAGAGSAVPLSSGATTGCMSTFARYMPAMAAAAASARLRKK